jgi:hypothetical protein
MKSNPEGRVIRNTLALSTRILWFSVLAAALLLPRSASAQCAWFGANRSRRFISPLIVSSRTDTRRWRVFKLSSFSEDPSGIEKNYDWPIKRW